MSFALAEDGAPVYAVSYAGRPVAAGSRLGLTLRQTGPLAGGFRVLDVTRASRDEKYTLVAGKTREARDRSEEMTVSLERSGEKPVRLDVVFRAFDDGAAFRYVIDFHGAYAGSGEERTSPNWLTREGVMGLEYNKWSDRVTPRHNVTIPFTRMLTGPMDYTPGGFRNVTTADFAPRNELPVVMTTRAQQLAMYVVYESPLQMLADTPSAYRGEPGAELLKAVPATWDETRVLDGKIGEYAVIARRSGSDWFVGAMTDGARKIAIPLGFLGGRACDATIWRTRATPPRTRPGCPCSRRGSRARARGLWS